MVKSRKIGQASVCVCVCLAVGKCVYVEREFVEPIFAKKCAKNNIVPSDMEAFPGGAKRWF